MKDNINTVDYWDQRFGTGDWERKGGCSQTRQFTEAQLPRLKLTRDFSGSLCDFGCGAGDGFPVYRKAFPRARLIGVDISEAATDLCRLHHGGLGDFLTGDVGIVPKVDVIVCSNVLEHVDDDKEVVRELLAKCGTLFVVVPYRERNLKPLAEHIRSYDQHSFDEFSPTRREIFNTRGWSEYGRQLYLDVYLKNVIRWILRRPLRYRNKQILFEFCGSVVPERSVAGGISR